MEDSGDMGDSSLASLQNTIEANFDSEETEEVVPLFIQGVRYRDCQEIAIPFTYLKREPRKFAMKFFHAW